MLRVGPFTALRPQPGHAARLASVPYDVVTTDEARALAKDNPLSFLHVIRPEIDLPEGTDPYDDRVYARGRENLDRFIRDEIMFRETQPAMYLYRQVMDHRPQIGIVCCCHVADYAEGVIKKHEETRPQKEDDRTRHMLALDANTGPVFLTYRDEDRIARLMQIDTNSRPHYHFDANDGVTHTVWAVADPQVYVDAFRDVACAYVADGHHRAASAARASETKRAGNPDHTGDEPYNWFLVALFPAGEVRILPYHRVLRDLGDHSVTDVLAALAGVGTVTETTDATPDRPGVLCLYLDGKWHRVEIDPASIDRTDPVASLDVALLHDRVLAPIFGIEDARNDPRIDFVGGSRGTGELARQVDAGEAAMGISMYPTTIEQLLDVADAGRMMPPKSTWFEPKLRSGLFVHPLG